MFAKTAKLLIKCVCFAKIIVFSLNSKSIFAKFCQFAKLPQLVQLAHLAQFDETIQVTDNNIDTWSNF